MSAFVAHIVNQAVPCRIFLRRALMYPQSIYLDHGRLIIPPAKEHADFSVPIRIWMSDSAIMRSVETEICRGLLPIDIL